MITRLTGLLAAKSPTEIVIDVQGVGYGVSIPLSTYEALGEVNSPVNVLTYLHVREDALQLYGFATAEERDLFRLLIGVNGIGPKMAQGILSGIPAPDLKNHIASGNFPALTAIPGVGRKIAERLVLELREKVGRLEPASALLAGASAEESRIRSEALLALTSLGYHRAAAEKALRDAIRESHEEVHSTESLIKASLRRISK